MTDVIWLSSTRCESNACVEVAFTGDGVVRVRDGKHGRYSQELQFDRAEWRAFVAGVKDGEFDVNDG